MQKYVTFELDKYRTTSVPKSSPRLVVDKVRLVPVICIGVLGLGTTQALQQAMRAFQVAACYVH